MGTIITRLFYALAALLLFGTMPVAGAEFYVLESADWIPTSRVMAYPTSYAVAASYLMPTAYVTPSVYATAYVSESLAVLPTTYVVPTYYETRFRRRGLLGRALFGDRRATYLPTTAYYPTTYYIPSTSYLPTRFDSPVLMDRSVVATEYVTETASVCCDQIVSASPAPTMTYMRPERAPTSTSIGPSSRPRQSVVESKPDENSIPSDVEPLAPEPPARTNPPAQAPPRTNQATAPPPDRNPGKVSGAAESPPPAPAAQPRPQQGTSPQAGTNSPPAGVRSPSNVNPKPSQSQTDIPVAPADETDIQPAPGSGLEAAPLEQRRESRRYVPSTRAIRPEYRNILFGNVRTRNTDEPEEGVRIRLTSRTSAFQERETMSDAFGQFRVKLPDGDWTVKVTMPSGRIYAVSEITVSNGLITDDLGRDIPSLIITR